MPEIRKGMPDAQLTREEFARRYQRANFFDSRFEQAPQGGIETPRRSPHGTPMTVGARRASPQGRGGLCRPGYELSVDWLEASRRSRPPSGGITTRIAVAHAARQRFGTQRPDLSRRNVEDLAACEMARESSRQRGFEVDVSISAGSLPNTAASSIPASPASRPPCRSATGRARAIPIMRWARSTTG